MGLRGTLQDGCLVQDSPGLLEQVDVGTSALLAHWNALRSAEGLVSLCENLAQPQLAVSTFGKQMLASQVFRIQVQVLVEHEALFTVQSTLSCHTLSAKMKLN